MKNQDQTKVRTARTLAMQGGGLVSKCGLGKAVVLSVAKGKKTQSSRRFEWWDQVPENLQTSNRSGTRYIYQEA